MSFLVGPFLCMHAVQFYFLCLLDGLHFSFIDIVSVTFQVIEMSSYVTTFKLAWSCVVQICILCKPSPAGGPLLGVQKAMLELTSFG